MKRLFVGHPLSGGAACATGVSAASEAALDIPTPRFGTDAGGGVYIVDVDTREEAQALIDTDPFSIGGLFKETRLTPWRKAYVAGICYLRPLAAE